MLHDHIHLSAFRVDLVSILSFNQRERYMVDGLANPEAVTSVIGDEFYDRVYSDIADRRIKSKKVFTTGKF